MLDEALSNPHGERTTQRSHEPTVSVAKNPMYFETKLQGKREESLDWLLNWLGSLLEG